MSEFIVVENLKKKYVNRNFLGRKTIYEPIKSVSFCINKGECLGLAGASGCGKSTIAKILLKLTDITSGKVYIEGMDLENIKSKVLKDYRKKCQMVFQDPYSSLTPVIRVGDLIKEAVSFHKISDKSNVENYVKEIMKSCDIDKEAYNKFPNEFSGGQRQRIAIARALSLKPEFLIADEPVSALDPSVQAQILNLLKKKKEEENLTLLFISHDMDVLKFMCDRIIEIRNGVAQSLNP